MPHVKERERKREKERERERERNGALKAKEEIANQFSWIWDGLDSDCQPNRWVWKIVTSWKKEKKKTAVTSRPNAEEIAKSMPTDAAELYHYCFSLCAPVWAVYYANEYVKRALPTGAQSSEWIVSTSDGNNKKKKKKFRQIAEVFPSAVSCFFWRGIVSSVTTRS